MSVFYGYPGTATVALGDGGAEEKFTVAVVEGGVERVGGAVAGGDVGVDCAVELFERVGIALDVAAGIAGAGGGAGVEERWIAQERAVGFAAFADPELL